MPYLLDTCIVSEFIKPSPSRSVISWLDKTNEMDLFLSVVTIGEITHGIEKVPSKTKREKIEAWLKNDLLNRFKNKIIPLDTDVMIAWGILTAQLEKTGKPMPAVDSLIAATAIYHQLILVTRNQSDFKNASLEILNPWK